ncbi:hypothetical protein L1987_52679 [Smallanthus sonchifolius]|uniref:Uncharacterized protein n=1 Tax=Smallanthus sonchifolius TaxID=185202 RepID=A0ACB9ETH2_9ASTR|nr:hypothetical protein L1987_52679 [Smallanthus sonchifolius]
MLRISPMLRAALLSIFYRLSACSADLRGFQSPGTAYFIRRQAQRYPINVVGGTKERGTLMDIAGRLATIQQEIRQAENEKLQQEQSLSIAPSPHDQSEKRGYPLSCFSFYEGFHQLHFPPWGARSGQVRITYNTWLYEGRSESFLLDYSHRGGDEAETLATRDSATLDRTVPYQWKPSMKKVRSELGAAISFVEEVLPVNRWRESVLGGRAWLSF